LKISDKELKKLWGLAAGKCSHPECEIDCIMFLDSDNPTVIGEMAHIIAEKPDGPRGVEIGGENVYENLILLCPTHHTIIDKAPKDKFPVELLLSWKSDHENKIKELLRAKRYPSSKEMAHAIKRLLIMNQKVWEEFGPESETALDNPGSNISEYWSLKKLSTIIPNNRKIIDIIKKHEDLFEIDDYEICIDFINHAELFEQNTYTILDKTKRFPKKFEEVISKYVQL